MENKPESLLVASLGKTLDGMPRQVGGGPKQSTRRGCPSQTEDSQTQREC